MAEATRTCVGCRGKGARAQMLRFVWVQETAVPDPARRAPGRGAWLHDDPACAELAARRGSLAYSLRRQRARRH